VSLDGGELSGVQGFLYDVDRQPEDVSCSGERQRSGEQSIDRLEPCVLRHYDTFSHMH
jgi:hypothetical protein